MGHTDEPPGEDAAAAAVVGVAPSVAFSGNKKLAKWAQITDSGMVDIHEDVQTVAYLHTGKLDGRNTHAMTRRVLRRAHAYSIQHITDGNWVVLRRMADGRRVVPPKIQR